MTQITTKEKCFGRQDHLNAIPLNNNGGKYPKDRLILGDNVDDGIVSGTRKKIHKIERIPFFSFIGYIRNQINKLRTRDIKKINAKNKYEDLEFVNNSVIKTDEIFNEINKKLADVNLDKTQLVEFKNEIKQVLDEIFDEVIDKNILLTYESCSDFKYKGINKHNKISDDAKNIVKVILSFLSTENNNTEDHEGIFDLAGTVSDIYDIYKKHGIIDKKKKRNEFMSDFVIDKIFGDEEVQRIQMEKIRKEALKKYEEVRSDVEALNPFEEKMLIIFDSFAKYLNGIEGYDKLIREKGGLSEDVFLGLKDKINELNEMSYECVAESFYFMFNALLEQCKNINNGANTSEKQAIIDASSIIYDKLKNTIVEKDSDISELPKKEELEQIFLGIYKENLENNELIGKKESGVNFIKNSAEFKKFMQLFIAGDAEIKQEFENMHSIINAKAYDNETGIKFFKGKIKLIENIISAVFINMMFFLHTTLWIVAVDKGQSGLKNTKVLDFLQSKFATEFPLWLESLIQVNTGSVDYLIEASKMGVMGLPIIILGAFVPMVNLRSARHLKDNGLKSVLMNKSLEHHLTKNACCPTSLNKKLAYGFLATLGIFPIIAGLGGIDGFGNQSIRGYDRKNRVMLNANIAEETYKKLDSKLDGMNDKIKDFYVHSLEVLYKEFVGDSTSNISGAAKYFHDKELIVRIIFGDIKAEDFGFNTQEELNSEIDKYVNKDFSKKLEEWNAKNPGRANTYRCAEKDIDKKDPSYAIVSKMLKQISVYKNEFKEAYEKAKLAYDVNKYSKKDLKNMALKPLHEIQTSFNSIAEKIIEALKVDNSDDVVSLKEKFAKLTADIDVDLKGINKDASLSFPQAKTDIDLDAYKGEIKNEHFEMLKTMPFKLSPSDFIRYLTFADAKEQGRKATPEEFEMRNAIIFLSIGAFSLELTLISSAIALLHVIIKRNSGNISKITPLVNERINKLTESVNSLECLLEKRKESFNKFKEACMAEIDILKRKSEVEIKWGLNKDGNKEYYLNRLIPGKNGFEIINLDNEEYTKNGGLKLKASNGNGNGNGSHKNSNNGNGNGNGSHKNGNNGNGNGKNGSYEYWKLVNFKNLSDFIIKVTESGDVSLKPVLDPEKEIKDLINNKNGIRKIYPFSYKKDSKFLILYEENIDNLKARYESVTPPESAKNISENISKEFSESDEFGMAVNNSMIVLQEPDPKRGADSTPFDKSSNIFISLKN